MITHFKKALKAFFEDFSLLSASSKYNNRFVNFIVLQLAINALNQLGGYFGVLALIILVAYVCGGIISIIELLFQDDKPDSHKE